MVSYLFDEYILIYTFAGLCGLGLFVRFIVNMVYKHLVKESGNPGETKNKMIKKLKMKFETCYKLKIGVNNVDTFVDKNVLVYRFCGALLSTWENFCGQVLYLILLMVPVCTVFGVTFQCEQERVLLTGSVGILTGAILILVDKSINLLGKKKMIRLNLLDYLDNFFKIRLELEAFHPELIDQFRREYFQTLEAGKQVSASAAVKEEPKDELNRRRAARVMKEEERKQQLLKREEEQRRLEESRREDERRRLEERRLAAARRREEELLKLEEERKALEAKRDEIKRKAEQKQQLSERKRIEKEEKETLLNSMEQDLNPAREKTDRNAMQNELDSIVDKQYEESQQIEKEKSDQSELNHTYQDKVKPAAELPQSNIEKNNSDLEQRTAEESAPEGLSQVSVTQEIKTEKLGPKILSAAQRSTNKDLQQNLALNKLKLQGISAQEEKLIEDVLKEFFA